GFGGLDRNELAVLTAHRSGRRVLDGLGGLGILRGCRRVLGGDRFGGGLRFDLQRRCFLGGRLGVNLGGCGANRLAGRQLRLRLVLRGLGGLRVGRLPRVGGDLGFLRLTSNFGDFTRRRGARLHGYGSRKGRNHRFV